MQNISTCYVYGGADELIALYDDNGTILQQKELPLYGSGRLGTYNRVSNSFQYELTDHLGNVRLVINQDKVNEAADVVYYSDYYPFGSPLTLANNDYRYGYQGQYAEVDKETGWNNFDFRMYDAQIGRWMSTDPAGQFHSPYVGMGNNPVIGVDPDGRFVGTLLGALIGGGIKAIQGGSWNDIGKAALAGAVGGAVFDLAIATGGASVGVMIAAGAMGGMAQEFTNQQLNHGNNPRAIVEAGIWGMAGGALGVMMPNVGRVIKGFSANIGIGKATSTVISETGESLGANGLISADLAAEGGEKAIVIGEGMYRVKPAAQSIGGKWYQAWSKNFPNGRLMTDIELNAAKARNARWLNSKINQGYKIYDIGPKGINITSPFYQLELDIIQKTGYPTTPLLGF